MATTEELFSRYGPSYRWLATLTVVTVMMAVILSSTIVNVAIPDVMGAFGIGQIEAQWLSTGFLAATTATMLLSAWAEQSFGPRATYVAALSAFTIGSLLGGVALNEHVLILARVIQGASAGIIQPLSMVVLFRVFPENQRGRAMGIFGIGIVLAPALGPWIGGVMMEHFNWRAVFYLVMPLSVVGMVLAMFFLPGRVPGTRSRIFDVAGFALLCAFLVSLLIGLTNGQRLGWKSLEVVTSLILSAVSFAAFVWRGAVAPAPIINLRVFESGQFAAYCVIGFVLGAGMFGSTYLLPLFVQTIQNLPPTESGLLLMPGGIVLAVVIPLAGAMSDRTAPAMQIAAGLAAFAMAAFLTGEADVDTTFAMLALWTVLTRIGLGLLFPPLSAGSLRSLPQDLMAQGSGVSNFIRQLGGAFGVNISSVILDRRTTLHADALFATQTPDNHAMLARITDSASLLRGVGVPDSERIPLALWHTAQAIYSQASTEAFQDAFHVTAWIFVAAFVPTWYIHYQWRRMRDAGSEAGTRGFSQLSERR